MAWLDPRLRGGDDPVKRTCKVYLEYRVRLTDLTGPGQGGQQGFGFEHSGPGQCSRPLFRQGLKKALHDERTPIGSHWPFAQGAIHPVGAGGKLTVC